MIAARLKNGKMKPEVQKGGEFLMAAREASRLSQTAAVPGNNSDFAASIRALQHDVHLEIYPGKHRRRTRSAVTNSLADVLTKQLLVYVLKQRFKAANPDVGTDEIDWGSLLPARSTFSEGLEVMKQSYPHFQWERTK